MASAADTPSRDQDSLDLKSNIDKKLFLGESNVASFWAHHSGAATIVFSNDIPLVTSCLYKSHGGSATKSDNYMKYTWRIKGACLHNQAHKYLTEETLFSDSF